MENKSDKQILFNTLRSILETITMELKETIKRKFKKEYEDYNNRVNTIKTDKDLTYCFDKLNSLLDQLQITRIDTKRYIDTTSVESENKEKGI